MRVHLVYDLTAKSTISLQNFLHLIGDSEENASALVYDLIANDTPYGQRPDAFPKTTKAEPPQVFVSYAWGDTSPTASEERPPAPGSGRRKAVPNVGTGVLASGSR